MRKKPLYLQITEKRFDFFGSRTLVNYALRAWVKYVKKGPVPEIEPGVYVLVLKREGLKLRTYLVETK